jgi:branched-chain amino acid transport system ATP-binding protein
MNFFEVKKIHKSFGSLQAVNDVSFKLKKNTIKSIIGPNGAGKSTLFNLISGYYKADSGTIIFKDKEIQKMFSHNIAYLGISRTFQTVKLFPKMTVLENIMIARHSKSRSGILSSIFKLPSAIREERFIKEKASYYLKLLGLTDLENFEATNLPFGKQRLVEMARALALEPELLLLDEPSSGLNIYESKEFANLILKIKEWGVSVILVEHDMSLVMEISDEIVVLNYGKKIAEGNTFDIRKNPEVINIYLGEDDAEN